MIKSLVAVSWIAAQAISKKATVCYQVVRNSARFRVFSLILFSGSRSVNVLDRAIKHTEKYIEFMIFTIHKEKILIKVRWEFFVFLNKNKNAWLFHSYVPVS